jgi:hypothetical protein
MPRTAESDRRAKQAYEWRQTGMRYADIARRLGLKHVKALIETYAWRIDQGYVPSPHRRAKPRKPPYRWSCLRNDLGV